jgi:hypothetical protein
MGKRLAALASAITLVTLMTGSIVMVSGASTNDHSIQLRVRRVKSSAAGPVAPDQIESYISQSVVLSYWLANIDQAPALIRPQLRSAKALAAVNHPQQSRSSDTEDEGVLGDVFNLDPSGLPQNEESVAVCANDPNVVLGGTNDFRRVLEGDAGITGWHLSRDGGASVANEGILPSLELGGAPRISGGDPVVATDPGCNLYAGSLNFNPENPFEGTSGVGVYRSTPERLTSCPGGLALSCWPVRRVIARAAPNHFLDKEWLDVGPSGAAGTVVWTVFADVEVDPETGQQTDSLKAVRCDAALTHCTSPILISGDDRHAQLGDVTIGPDGRVYVTWSELLNIDEFDLANPPEVIHKLRVAEPGRTTFGPERVVDREEQPIINFKLHANDFRIPPYAKNEVRMQGGEPRVFLIWEGCRARPLGFVCEEPAIKLRFSDDLGRSWSPTRFLSVGGDNYFPTISNDPSGTGLAAAWYTNRFDPEWHHQQDVELVGLDPITGEVTSRQRVTPVSNEPDADGSPFSLGEPGSFIGDYIEVDVLNGVAYLHYNMNYREQTFLGQGFPIHQQDNYLTVRRL